ncbi:hypothetical protein Bhyg_07516 [Pseudolycoriella hygida]|uniref:Uncharacterized protein n=1 Tax=Pseudolycoriella hygida TaxID=35572 RepID=A0A9Q0N4N2_9DIPT|nr:hypothetical protein Bhyg_07516 [Pseudolycoriella hygida]
MTVGNDCLILEAVKRLLLSSFGRNLAVIKNICESKWRLNAVEEGSENDRSDQDQNIEDEDNEAGPSNMQSTKQRGKFPKTLLKWMVVCDQPFTAPELEAFVEMVKD